MKSFAKTLTACLVVMFFCFCLVGCFSSTYSADSIKNSLTNAGYIVSEDYDLQFDDGTKASELQGIQKIYTVVKGTDEDREFSIVLVFDSIQNVEKGINDDRLIKIYQSAKYQCGDNKKDSMAMGMFNNVAFAGTQACKDTIGLK